MMMQYTNCLNSTPSQQQLLGCLAQWLEHSVYNRGVASSRLIIGMNRHNRLQKVDVDAVRSGGEETSHNYSETSL